MKLNRQYSKLKKISKKDDCYVNLPPAECVNMMWDITAEIWSLKGEEHVKRRLQRNVINIIRKQG